MVTSNQPKNQKQAKPLTSLERSQNTSQFNGRAHPAQLCLTQSCCLIRTQLSNETLMALRLEEKFPKCPTPAPLKRLLTAPKDYLGQPFLHQKTGLQSS